MAIVLAALALAAVAAAGVLRPFGEGRVLSLERQADPLEDERIGLLRALRDLDQERELGTLSQEDHRQLKAEMEVRAVAVLRALEARDGRGELAAGLSELKDAAGARAGPAGRRRWILTAAAGAVGLGVIALVLLGTASDRQSGSPITGVNVGGAGMGRSDLSFFEQRVIDHPQDLAARLDLAQRYLQAGDARGAATQYLAALQIDPGNAEAHAALGYVLYRSGKAAEGLSAVNQALAVAPTDPEALYFKGLILLRGLHRPEDAAAAFRQYLAAAPFGARRAEVQRLLVEAARG